MTTINTDYARTLSQSLSVARRAAAAESALRFAQVYLASHCSKPFSQMHHDLFAELEKLIQQRGGRLAVAAPRGHAKSTIVSLAFVLWCLFYDKERLILVVSATREQAVQLLTHIKDQLLRNELLKQDFPSLCRLDGGPGSGRQPKPWRDNRIMLANGAMVMACGAGQSLRGARNGKERPGLIIADDIEEQEQVISEDQRRKLTEWFNRTLLHAGHTETNVIVVGTVLHHASLLATLLNPSLASGWRSSKYQAVISFADRTDLWDHWTAIFRGTEEFEGKSGPDAAKAYFAANEEEMLRGTSVLWPEWESYHDLMVMREREGRGSFQAEKQNEPLDPEQCIFAPEALHYWDEEYPDPQTLVRALQSHGRIYGACDPSLANRPGKGDYTAIIILFRDTKTKINYVLAADIARRTPDQTIERIIQYAQMYSIRKFAVESNQFQSVMVDNLERRAKENGVSLRIKRVENRTNKQARIANLEPEVAQGRIRFRKRDVLLLEQLRAFPLGSHDDGPDALEMAVELANKPGDRFIVSCLDTGRVTYDSDWYQ